MVIGIEHIGLYAKDTKKLADWYVEYMNAKIVFQNENGVYFIAFSDKSMIEICKNDEASNPKSDMTEVGLRHIALSVDNFDKTVSVIKSSGAEILTDPVTLPNGVSTMFFRDIDGNILHLISRTNPLV